MTKLLVSVRNLEEARLAYDAGADLLDVKEPQRGSLGTADAVHLRAIIQEFASRLPISAAFGELLEETEPVAEALAGLAFAKFGLSGCGDCDDWAQRWRAQIARFPAGVSAVAVVYADRAAAAAPEPREIVEAAATAHSPVVLVDTFDKSQGPLLAHWSLSDIAEFQVLANDHQLQVALAGSLTVEAIAQLLPLSPAYVAVRGAVCRGGRAGPIDSSRIRKLATQVRRPERRIAEFIN